MSPSTPASAKLKYSVSPKMTWSRTRMPRIFAACASRLVHSRSSCDGAGSPEGWLCYVQRRVMCSLGEIPRFLPTFHRVSGLSGSCRIHITRPDSSYPRMWG